MGSAVIQDKTETELVSFRRAVYIAIQSAVSFEECAHKLVRMEHLTPALRAEQCAMLVECASQERVYSRYFALVSQRLAALDDNNKRVFEELFAKWYSTIHRLETNKLRNVAKLFAHLLFSDAISWRVLAPVRLTEDDTTSSSRIFLKVSNRETFEFLVF